jgi:hypothetical protein
MANYITLSDGSSQLEERFNKAYGPESWITNPSNPDYWIDVSADHLSGDRLAEEVRRRLR